MRRVLAAMSGGVDSAAAALLLLRAGYAVEGLTLRLLHSAVFPHEDCEADLRDARAVCAALGIPHRVLDQRDAFLRHVADPFVRDYRAGLTPNPCLNCNRQIKFGTLLDYALEEGFDALATGHYARVLETPEGFFFHRAKHIPKDQSYVLYGVRAKALPHLLLPLGDYDKESVRALAAAAGLPAAARPDSQDICFIRGEDYKAFIRRRLGEDTPGQIVREDGGVAGYHEGLDGFTIGQRKGIGGFGKPMYVLCKNAADRTVTVGKGESLLRRQVSVGELNWFCTPPSSFRAFVKLRYSHKGAMALAETAAEGTLLLSFDEAQRAPAPGQAAVLYDGERLLGGGIIRA